ncbi:sigma-70 family RNA polymerase sigma factor [Acrocarpospora macrocephala]|uniref:sigma-70 family RNA polymerase sigma factor n=1 Tax=Acrocarpospora macrocephala TaxID=150177 RepID=UPI001FE77B40|nr:sigma-70 family RNA polymerase sigma factor [Acrocarpospora macrocephala]
MSVYCSAACRQKAYRSRHGAKAGVEVHELIADLERRVKKLSPRPPDTFYADVTELSSSVGLLRRMARDAAQFGEAGEIVTRVPVTESAAEERDLELVAAVRSDDEWTFAGLLEPYRRELQVHCYRMVGSYDDSEDLVQDTFLRAWRNRDGFEGRSSFRAWLYRIATNACLDFLRRNTRRPQLYEGGAEPPPRITWLQPYPDLLLADVPAGEDGPEAAAVTRETMELVFLTAIQHLPPRQRAVLIVRDVLGWPAQEAATLLEMSVASVNSALQRARPALRKHLPGDRSEWAAATEPTEEERALLKRYMEVAERADTAAMTEMLHEDVLLTMPPSPLWFAGREAFVSGIAQVFDTRSPRYFGRWRHLPTTANRLPAAAGYVQRPGTTVYRAQVLDVLRVVDGKIVEITSFEPHLFPAFGLPLTL